MSPFPRDFLSSPSPVTMLAVTSAFLLGLLAFPIFLLVLRPFPPHSVFQRPKGLKRIIRAIQHEGITGPRMPPAIYHEMLPKVHAAFRRRFLLVASPIGGPAKDSYGDIDVCVALDPSGIFNRCKSPNDLRMALEQNGNRELIKLQKLLGATHALTKNKHTTTAQFALPWPDDGIDEPSRRIQVDLHVCLDAEDFEWHQFRYAHRDLFWIFKTMLSPFGLRLGLDGLQIRIEEIEEGDHLILLSKKPAEVIRFLGLSPLGPEWERPFESKDALFEYTTTCRFFCDLGEENITESDRERMGPLRVYRQWANEFVPKYREEGRFIQAPALTKGSIIEEVMRWFPGPRYSGVDAKCEKPRLYASIRDECDTRKLSYLKKQQENLFTRVIKSAVPLPRRESHWEWMKICAGPFRKIMNLVTRAISPSTPLLLYHHDPAQWRGICAKAFLKIITQDDESFGVQPPNLRTPDGLYMEKEIQDFIKDHCQQVGERAWDIQRDKYLEHKAKKEMEQKKKEEMGHIKKTD